MAGKLQVYTAVSRCRKSIYVPSKAGPVYEPVVLDGVTRDVYSVDVEA